MTSAVVPFSIDSGLFAINGTAGQATVKIHNTNTGKIIHSTLTTENGESSARGGFEVDGVSGEAARIQLDFLNPAGSRTGKLLPTGSKIDEFDGIRTSCIDVGNPCCFVQAEEMGVDGGYTPDQIEQHPDLLRRLDSIRRQAGVKMGLASCPGEVPGSVPKICVVSPSDDSSNVDLRLRAISVGQPHKAVPITVALSTTAASKLAGTVVQECVSPTMVDPAGVTLGHASGTLMV
ncbi:uncharacterized protein A1O9_10704 [Exophiala aquamarina CBS 119918]|uniref:Uncharacterized protein n=1 Tax=Exophiala aquamarina CBS 119918 TaxID=1182545 RepID=A0A072P0B5_9EURO|nr:uncharacterized protein A1O9_10704 [Exophiala aquamarina CBS 119918]KEF53256.1 hypothetical protein A1O9_10704 [Exophiala aquamarina CBS 119918]